MGTSSSSTADLKLLVKFVVFTSCPCHVHDSIRSPNRGSVPQMNSTGTDMSDKITSNCFHKPSSHGHRPLFPCGGHGSSVCLSVGFQGRRGKGQGRPCLVNCLEHHLVSSRAGGQKHARGGLGSGIPLRSLRMRINMKFASFDSSI